MRLSFIESLLPFTGYRKVLGKMPDGRVLHLEKLQAFSKVACCANQIFSRDSQNYISS